MCAERKCLTRASVFDHLQLTDLTIFNVSLNGLDEVPDELATMSKLESLNLNDNRLKACPAVVCHHPLLLFCASPLPTPLVVQRRRRRRTPFFLFCGCGRRSPRSRT